MIPALAAATPPPFATAAADIADAAIEPAVIPPAPNPTAPITAGSAYGATMAVAMPPIIAHQSKIKKIIIIHAHTHTHAQAHKGHLNLYQHNI